MIKYLTCILCLIVLPLMAISGIIIELIKIKWEGKEETYEEE